MPDTRTASLDTLRSMLDRGLVEKPNPYAAEMEMPEGFWDDAVPQEPLIKQQINMRVDPDILEFFKAQGKGHLTRMHSVLRSYVDAQKNRSTSL